MPLLKELQHISLRNQQTRPYVTKLLYALKYSRTQVPACLYVQRKKRQLFVIHAVLKST